MLSLWDMANDLRRNGQMSVFLSVLAESAGVVARDEEDMGKHYVIKSVSFIQSNFNGFGSGVVVPGTGISLQNRGCAFTLDGKSENCLGPEKKAFHTIIPGFLTKGGEAVGPFGVMGAFMQPQGHVQVLMNMIDFKLNPQEALDAPRWQWIKDKKVQVEPLFPKELAKQLSARGHEVEAVESAVSFGRGEMILKDKNGVYCGAAEPRAGGHVAAW